MALMGADDAVIAGLTPEQRELVGQVIDHMNPVSPRSAGVAFDNKAAMPNERIAAVRAPTLILHAKDDTLQLYPQCRVCGCHHSGRTAGQLRARRTPRPGRRAGDDPPRPCRSTSWTTPAGSARGDTQPHPKAGRGLRPGPASMGCWGAPNDGRRELRWAGMHASWPSTAGARSMRRDTACSRAGRRTALSASCRCSRASTRTTTGRVWRSRRRARGLSMRSAQARLARPRSKRTRPRGTQRPARPSRPPGPPATRRRPRTWPITRWGRPPTPSGPPASRPERRRRGGRRTGATVAARARAGRDPRPRALR